MNKNSYKTEYEMLRVHEEPCRYYSDRDVHRLLTASPYDYYQSVRTMLKKIATGEASMVLPPKLIIPDSADSGDFRLMPCVIRNESCLKTVKLVGTNMLQEQVPDQITVGKAFVIDNSENFISHVFDACLLSSARTAICACLAIEYLAGATSSVTVVGAGRVGYYAAYYILSLEFADSLVITDTDLDRANNVADLLRSKFPGQSILASSYSDLGDTDILILATTSTDVVYHSRDFTAGLVVSLGADVDYQHELDPDLAKSSAIFVDTFDSTNYGDLKAWIDAGLVTTADITDLFTLVTDRRGGNGGRSPVFISTGSALFDNLTIAYILQGNMYQE